MAFLCSSACTEQKHVFTFCVKHSETLDKSLLIFSVLHGKFKTVKFINLIKPVEILSWLVNLLTLFLSLSHRMEKPSTVGVLQNFIFSPTNYFYFHLVNRLLKSSLNMMTLILWIWQIIIAIHHFLILRNIVINSVTICWNILQAYPMELTRFTCMRWKSKFQPKTDKVWFVQ